MILAVVLSGIYLTLLGVFSLKKFMLYGLLTAFIYTVLSIELLADLDGLTLGILTILTVFSLLTISINIRDIIGCLIIALPCIFWLNTQEFVDGFAYSNTIVALGAAVACNLLFDKQKRQTLCAIVLLTCYIICYASNVYLSVIDLATSFLVAMIFTQNYDTTFEISPLRSK